MGGMVYPTESGRWWDEHKLHQLLCEGGFHTCRCGDISCLTASAAAKQRCVNLSFSSQSTTKEVNMTESCCTVTTSAASSWMIPEQARFTGLALLIMLIL